MGCFSWLYATRDKKISNIVDGDLYKILIPKEYGGGFIQDHYQGYGNVVAQIKKADHVEYKRYDLYELLAFWNSELPYKNGKVKDYLKWNGDFTPMKEKDEHTDKNRIIGIDIGCYDEDIEKLPYPLKLVPTRCQLEYEEVRMPSYGDPNQGFYHVTWVRYDKENVYGNLWSRE